MRWIVRALVLAAGCAMTGCNSAEPAGNNGRPQPSNRLAAPSTSNAAPSKLHHPVSTQSEIAQRHFDAGLTYVYAFNHDEGLESFRKASAADPKLAVAYWG